MTFDSCLVVFLLLGAFLVDDTYTAVYRARNDAALPFRLRRLHHRSAMYGEYYQPEMMYVPGMTTFTGRDTFSTGYLDPLQPPTLPEENKCEACNSIPKEESLPLPEPGPEPDFEETTKVHNIEIEQSPEEETSVRTATEVPIIEEVTTQRTKTKIATKRPPLEEEDEEDEEFDYWPYVKNQGRKVPPYNVFFPMMFGYGNGRSGHEEYPGGATAIANAFSSGKGGVATSHATAFGNAPPLHKHSNWKRRSQKDE